MPLTRAEQDTTLSIIKSYLDEHLPSLHIHDVNAFPQFSYSKDVPEVSVIYSGDGNALDPEMQGNIYRGIGPRLLDNGINHMPSIRYISNDAKTAAFNAWSNALTWVHRSSSDARVYYSPMPEVTYPQLDFTWPQPTVRLFSKHPNTEPTMVGISVRPDPTSDIMHLSHEDQIAHLTATGMSAENINQLDSLTDQWLSETEQDRLDSLAQNFTSENRNDSELFQEWMDDRTVIRLAELLEWLSLPDYPLGATYLMSRALESCITAHMMASLMREPVPVISPEDESD